MDDKLLEKMVKRFKRVVSEDDSIRIYTLCAKCKATVKVFGMGEVTEDKKVYIL